MKTQKQNLDFAGTNLFIARVPPTPCGMRLQAMLFCRLDDFINIGISSLSGINPILFILANADDHLYSSGFPRILRNITNHLRAGGGTGRRLIATCEKY